ncbi:response regulator transcription factor [Tomitella fengzijianii]|uniref:Response regulator transcription factor n=1 Tax=Tomitella fengzijianii TaxID=2597660 RepID=A0A516X394_9ACTN|nr:response regulator transcription factor [Tomitella fengzijianii]QDQ97535.1 response regulator transcription factor [Tomitella fengzijianii]
MKVVIGEDDVLLRQGLASVLAQGGFEVAAAVGDADALPTTVARHSPDLVVTDIRMPPGDADDGLVAALRVRAEHPDTAVVVLSQYVQRRYAAELLADHPARVGYLLKQRISDLDAFLAALRTVVAGGTAIDPEVIEVMVHRARMIDGHVARLTPRQREVLALIAEGRSNSSIAARLVISEKAVVQHTSHIYDALGIPVDANDHRRVLAVVRYLAG